MSDDLSRLVSEAVATHFELDASTIAGQPRTVTPLPSTGGGTFAATVERVASAAPDGWSVVVKRIDGTHARRGWDREIHAATDPALMTRLPDRLCMPRLLASERAGSHLTLVLEDLGSTDTPTVDGLAEVAGLLARWNSSPSASAPWWSTDALRTEFRILADHPERLASPQPAAAHEALRQQLVALLEQAPALLASLDAKPMGPTHLDAYTRNLVFGSDGTIGLVDWANFGTAPVGTDPATLFVLSLSYCDVGVELIGPFETAVVTAMVANLGTASAHAARTTFAAVSRLRFLAMMMNALPMVEARDPAVSAIVGCPLDDIVEQWIAIGDHLLTSG